MSSVETLTKDSDSYQPFDMDQKLFQSAHRSQRKCSKHCLTIRWILILVGLLLLACSVVAIYLNTAARLSQLQKAIDQRKAEVENIFQSITTDNSQLKELLQNQMNRTGTLNALAQETQAHYVELKDVIYYLEAENTDLRQKLKAQLNHSQNHETTSKSLQKVTEGLKDQYKDLQQENMQLHNRLHIQANATTDLLKTLNSLMSDNTNLHIRLQTQTNNISFLGNLARDFQSRLNVLAEKSTEQEHQAEMFETGYTTLHQYFMIYANQTSSLLNQTNDLEIKAGQMADMIVFLENKTRSTASESDRMREVFLTKMNTNELETTVSNLTNQTMTLRALSKNFEQGYRTLDDGWVTPFNGYQYKYMNSYQTWYNARTYCQAKGGDLAVKGVQDMRTRLVLKTALGINDNCWVGLNDISSEGSWNWIGSASSYSGNIATDSTAMWYTNRPSSYSYNNYDCAYVRYQDLLLFDSYCSSGYYYLCEKPL